MHPRCNILYKQGLCYVWALCIPRMRLGYYPVDWVLKNKNFTVTTVLGIEYEDFKNRSE